MTGNPIIEFVPVIATLSIDRVVFYASRRTIFRMGAPPKRLEIDSSDATAPKPLVVGRSEPKLQPLRCKYPEVFRC
jgi:hypothetical protein